MKTRSRSSARLRADDDLAPRGVDREHVKRRAPCDAEAATLAHGEMDDALVPAENPACLVHDVAGLRSAGAKPFDHARIAARGHEADVLAVGLGGDGEAEPFRLRPHLVLLHAAEGEAQERELRRRGGEEEVALVARPVDRPVERGPTRLRHAPHVVAGGERVRPQIAGDVQQIAGTSRAHCSARRGSASRRAGKSRRNPRLPPLGSAPRSRARSGGCRAGRRPGGHRRCPRRHSRSPAAPARRPTHRAGA